MNIGMQNAFIAGLASGGVIEQEGGGVSLNIAYGEIAPEDTTKLWVKTSQPQNVTVDYDIDNGVESIETLTTVLPNAAYAMGCGTVGKKCYLFGGMENNLSSYINVFDTETNAITTLVATLPSVASIIACGVVGTKIYLFGGHSDVIAVFDTETETITTLSTTLPIATFAIACGVVGANCYLFGGGDDANDSPLNTIDKFTVTFPLNEGDVYLQSDVFKNKFTLVPTPTEVKMGVSAVYVGNAQNEAEYAEAYLHDGTGWQPIT